MPTLEEGRLAAARALAAARKTLKRNHCTQAEREQALLTLERDRERRRCAAILALGRARLLVEKSFLLAFETELSGAQADQLLHVAATPAETAQQDERTTHILRLAGPDPFLRQVCAYYATRTQVPAEQVAGVVRQLKAPRAQD
jgi:hypothetical protein